MIFPEKIMGKVQGFLDYISFNFGYSKNSQVLNSTLVLFGISPLFKSRTKLFQIAL